MTIALTRKVFSGVTVCGTFGEIFGSSMSASTNCDYCGPKHLCYLKQLEKCLNLTYSV